VIAAVAFGWGPALTAVIASVLAYNYFLLAPRYTLQVADPANVWALILLLIIAMVVSGVAAQSRRRAVAARRSADQERALHGFARDIVSANDVRSVGAASAEALSRLFAQPAVVLLSDDDELKLVGSAGGERLSAADEDAARWSLASRLPVRAGAYPAEQATYDFWPVVSRQRRSAALGVRISGGDDGRPPEPERLVEIVAGYLAVALDREALAADAIAARVQVEGERLKADLLAAVSHDLKTPLSTILFSLQSLQTYGEAHDAAARADLLRLAETETARLSAMVANLLDVNRLEAGALAVRLEPVEPAKLATAAIAKAGPELGRLKLVNEVGKRAARLRVDSALFETALVNVLHNAAKYAPAESNLRLRSGEDGRLGWIEVLDEGPGFAGPVEPLFVKFARGVEGDGRPPGTGLGLAIARGFMESQGGGVEAANRDDGPGARVRLFAPLAAVKAPAQ
jgi:two-component system sensor histidine kinase KdpD